MVSSAGIRSAKDSAPNGRERTDSICLPVAATTSPEPPPPSTTAERPGSGKLSAAESDPLAESLRTAWIGSLVPAPASVR